MILGGALAAGLASAVLAAESLHLAQAAPQQQAQAKTKSQPQAQAAQPSGEEAVLKQRVDQLEEQLVDMQVVIGTLQSLARGGGNGAAAAAEGGGGGGLDSVRLDGLETQLRALAAQVQQLTDQVRALGAQPRRSDAEPPSALPGTRPTSIASAAGAAAAVATPASESFDSGRFGSTTVTAGNGGDSIGGLIESDQPADNRGARSATGAAPPTATTMAALPPAFGAAMAPNGTGDANSGNAKQLYETAYGYLMQRDYAAAQGAFEDFLSRYPQDSLAGNAQYWLGEAHFVRGEYKAAAGSFLKGYQNYSGNARAADSLLKLAMSLDRLGQKDAACSSFNELSTRFPNAPENVKLRAKSERQRIGCS